MTCFHHGFPSHTVLNRDAKFRPRCSRSTSTTWHNKLKDLIVVLTWDDTIISVLLYADNIVLIAPTEENRQLMLDTLNSWCRKLKLTVTEPGKNQSDTF